MKSFIYYLKSGTPRRFVMSWDKYGLAMDDDEDEEGEEDGEDDNKEPFDDDLGDE